MTWNKRDKIIITKIVKIINPNTTMEMTEGIGDAARSVAREGTEIISVSPEFGPVSIESYYDEYVSACGVLDEVRKGNDEDIDAYVIACYGDPGLHAARELTILSVPTSLKFSTSIGKFIFMSSFTMRTSFLK